MPIMPCSRHNTECLNILKNEYLKSTVVIYFFLVALVIFCGVNTNSHKKFSTLSGFISHLLHKSVMLYHITTNTLKLSVRIFGIYYIRDSLSQQIP